jgi:hypothetical protein
MIEQGRAPVAEEVARQLGVSKAEVVNAFEALERSRLLARLPNTQRLLMLWPFSNLPTPFRVQPEGGRTYFANCAWDAVGIHTVLAQPVRIDSFCFHCADPIELVLRAGKVVEAKPPTTIPHFTKPAGQWWENIVDTCGNTMNFFASMDHLNEWRSAHRDLPGHTLTLDQLLALSAFVYPPERLNLDYARPTREQWLTLFESLGLVGDFWRL